MSIVKRKNPDTGEINFLSIDVTPTQDVLTLQGDKDVIKELEHLTFWERAFLFTGKVVPHNTIETYFKGFNYVAFSAHVNSKK